MQIEKGTSANMSVIQLMSDIYEDHWSHIDFMDNMNGGDCDCNIHNALYFIGEYAGFERETE